MWNWITTAEGTRVQLPVLKLKLRLTFSIYLLSVPLYFIFRLEDSIMSLLMLLKNPFSLGVGSEVQSGPHVVTHVLLPLLPYHSLSSTYVCILHRLERHKIHSCQHGYWPELTNKRRRRGSEQNKGSVIYICDWGLGVWVTYWCLKWFFFFTFSNVELKNKHDKPQLLKHSKRSY